MLHLDFNKSIGLNHIFVWSLLFSSCLEGFLKFESLKFLKFKIYKKQRYYLEPLHVLILLQCICICSLLGPQPDPPTNVTVRQQKNGLLISWSPPKNSTVPVHYYVVNYRTVGRWVPLTDKVKGKTWFVWKTFSRGATYHFQVTFSSHIHHVHSHVPSIIHGWNEYLHNQSYRLEYSIIQVI